MILCIEVYPCNNDDNSIINNSIHHASSSQQQQQQQHQQQQQQLENNKPSFVHFASLAWSKWNHNDTTTTPNNGIIWSVGRRSGHCHLSSDKSVSREHCIIRIATTNQEYILEDDDNNNTNSQDDVTCGHSGINPIHATKISMNPIEQQSVQEECNNNALDQLCVVIENVGKLGTYMIEEYNIIDESKNKKVNNKNTSNDDSDSETDDEIDVISRKTQQQQQSQQRNNNSQLQQQLQNVTLSSVTQHLLNQSNMNGIIKQIHMNEKIVLKQLTLSFDDNHNHNQKLKRVIIQVGKLGSTIVITRMPTIYFLPSGTMAKKELQKFSNMLYRIGGHIIMNNNHDNNDNNNTNLKNDHFIKEFNIKYLLKQHKYRTLLWNNQQKQHKQQSYYDHNFMLQYYSSCYNCCYFIITAQYAASMKQLVSWTCSVPIVSPSFLNSLFVLEPQPNSNYNIVYHLPFIHDHRPKSDNNIFWYYEIIQPNFYLWSNLTMLLIPKNSSIESQQNNNNNENDNDIENLILSAGANVISLGYDIESMTDNEFIQHVTKIIIRNNNNIKNTNHNNTNNHHHYFIVQGMQTTKQRIKYEKLLLRSNTTLFDSKPILSVSTKHVAKCITTQSLLFPDLIIQKIDNNNMKKLSSSLSSDTVPSNSYNNTTTSANLSNDSSYLLETTGPITQQSMSMDNTKDYSFNNIINVVDTSRLSTVDESIIDTIDDSHDHYYDTHQSKDDSIDNNIDPITMKSNTNLITNIDQQGRKVIRSNFDNVIRSNDNVVRSNTNEMVMVATTSKHEELVLTQVVSNTIAASITTNHRISEKCDGWMTVLPKGKKRKALVHSKEEIRQKLGVDDIRDVAVTETVPGLIVQKYKYQSTTLMHHDTSVRQANKGPDFKLFRKNQVHIISPESRPAIRLRSVLPKESDNQRDIEAQQRALDEQQRRADALFNDHTASSRSTRIGRQVPSRRGT